MEKIFFSSKRKKLSKEEKEDLKKNYKQLTTNGGKQKGIYPERTEGTRPEKVKRWNPFGLVKNSANIKVGKNGKVKIHDIKISNN